MGNVRMEDACNITHELEVMYNFTHIFNFHRNMNIAMHEQCDGSVDDINKLKSGYLNSVPSLEI